jgi:hypothetical protein
MVLHPKALVGWVLLVLLIICAGYFAIGAVLGFYGTKEGSATTMVLYGIVAGVLALIAVSFYNRLQQVH